MLLFEIEVQNLCYSLILFSYPELQEHTTQFYTQEQIKDLVSYAGDRGIRVIPEVESA